MYFYILLSPYFYVFSVLCEERTNLIYPVKTTLIDGLQQYFQFGPLKDISFKELTEISDVVYQRYMCNTAYEDALGHTERDEAVYGPPAAPLVDIELGVDHFLQSRRHKLRNVSRYLQYSSTNF